MSDNRMLLKLNINTGNDHLQVRFDYDFKNTEMLDLIEDNLQDGIKEMKVDGVVTNDEALDFLQSALHGMAIGIAATRQQIEEEQE